MASTKINYDEFYNRRIYQDPVDWYSVNSLETFSLNHSVHDFFNPHYPSLMENFELIKNGHGYMIKRGHGKTMTKLYMCLWEIERELENDPNVSLSMTFFCDTHQQCELTLRHLAELLRHNKIINDYEPGGSKWQLRRSLRRFDFSPELPNVEYAANKDNRIAIDVCSKLSSASELAYNASAEGTDVISKIREVNQRRQKRKIIFDDTQRLDVLLNMRNVPGITDNIKFYG